MLPINKSQEISEIKVAKIVRAEINPWKSFSFSNTPEMSSDPLCTGARTRGLPGYRP